MIQFLSQLVINLYICKMNLFDKAKVKDNRRRCLYCDNRFTPDQRNFKRGWGRCCSKKCSSLQKVKYNNLTELEKKRLSRMDKFKKLGL